MAVHVDFCYLPSVLCHISYSFAQTLNSNCKYIFSFATLPANMDTWLPPWHLTPQTQFVHVKRCCVLPTLCTIHVQCTTSLFILNKKYILYTLCVILSGDSKEINGSGVETVPTIKHCNVMLNFSHNNYHVSATINVKKIHVSLHQYWMII